MSPSAMDRAIKDELESSLQQRIGRDCEVTNVRTASCAALFERYGMPLLLKLDIEGSEDRASEHYIRERLDLRILPLKQVITTRCCTCSWSRSATTISNGLTRKRSASGHTALRAGA